MLLGNKSFLLNHYLLAFLIYRSNCGNDSARCKQVFFCFVFQLQAFDHIQINRLPLAFLLLHCILHPTHELKFLHVHMVAYTHAPNQVCFPFPASSHDRHKFGNLNHILFSLPLPFLDKYRIKQPPGNALEMSTILPYEHARYFHSLQSQLES